MKNTRLLLMMCLLAGCAGTARQTTLQVASDATFAPFHYVDASGKPTGFDIALARAVVMQTGRVAEIIVLPYPELFSGLLAGSHDLVAATTGITAERQANYGLSDPYFATCQVAVVRAGIREPRSISDLVGLRIGASGSGTSAAAMRVIPGVHIPIEDGQGADALLEDSVDAWIVDEFDGVKTVRASRSELRVLPEGIAPEQYAFVLNADNLRLRQEINAGLRTVIANGELESLREKYGVNRGPDWPVDCGS